MFDMGEAVRDGDAFKSVRALCSLAMAAWLLGALLLLCGVQEGRDFIVCGLVTLLFLPDVTQRKVGDMSVTSLSFLVTLSWLQWLLLLVIAGVCGVNTLAVLGEFGWLWAVAYAAVALIFIGIVTRHMLRKESAPRGHAAS